MTRRVRRLFATGRELRRHFGERLLLRVRFAPVSLEPLLDDVQTVISSRLRKVS